MITDPEIRRKLSKAAFEFAAGSVSGPLVGGHNFGEYGGVPHSNYNKIVKENLLDFMKREGINGSRKMNLDQMKTFASRIESGLNYRGIVNSDLTAFNNAIRAQMVKGDALERSTTAVLERGRNYIERNPGRFRTAIIAGAVSTTMAAFLNESLGAVQVASTSENFKRGMQALADGNVSAARSAFCGPTRDANAEGGFVGELIGKGYKFAAIAFRDAYLTAENASHSALTEARNGLVVPKFPNGKGVGISEAIFMMPSNISRGVVQSPTSLGQGLAQGLFDLFLPRRP